MTIKIRVKRFTAGMTIVFTREGVSFSLGEKLYIKTLSSLTVLVGFIVIILYTLSSASI